MQPLSGWDLSYWLRSAYVLVMVCGSCTALAFILVSIMTFNPCTDFCKFSQFREYTRTLRKEEISRVVLVSFILVGFSQGVGICSSPDRRLEPGLSQLCLAQRKWTQILLMLSLACTCICIRHWHFIYEKEMLQTSDHRILTTVVDNILSIYLCALCYLFTSVPR